MTERMESFLNAMTILGLVLVSFILVVCVALGVMLVAGVFNKHYDPLVGLKFNKQESQVILENEGVIYLTVTANTAVIVDGAVLDDNTVDTEIKLTVRNARNVIDDSIIEVPSVVKKGEPFAVKAKLASDGSNKGGVCYINAETSDMLYRVASPIEIKVDVPVKKINLLAKDAKTNLDLDLSTTPFIYKDQAQLSVSVEPERSLYVFGDKTQTKEISYVSSTPDSANVGLNTGLLNIGFNPVYTDEKPLEKPYSTVKITAKIQQFSVKDPANEKLVTTTVEIGLYPLQLDKIIIKNPKFSDETAKFEINLSPGQSLKISAEETGISGVLNLGIFLQPTIVKDTSNMEESPLTDLSQFGIEASCENSKQNVPVALDIKPNTIPYKGKSVTYWEITPTRLLDSGETAYITMKMGDHSDKYAIKRQLVIREVKADTESFDYITNNEKIEKLSLSITKNGDSDKSPSGSNAEVFYSFPLTTANNEALSFTKVVNFVSSSNALSDDNHININEVSSQIIKANETTRLVDSDMKNKSLIIQPMGAGTVSVRSFLVRTNMSGQPIDAFYNIITTNEDEAQKQGYAKPTGFCDVKNISTAKVGEYIVQQEFPALTVTVIEKLSGFTLYTSSDFNNDSKIDKNEFTMGMGNLNTATLYARPNSTLSIPESSKNNNDKYPEINLKEILPEGGESIFIAENTGMVYATNGEKYAESYERYIKFTFTAKKLENETEKQRTLNLQWKYKSEENHSQTSLKVTTKYVPVSYITIDDGEQYKAIDNFGVDTTNNYWNWTLTPQIDENVTKNGKTYYRLMFASSVNSSGELSIPTSGSMISAEDAENKLIKAPTDNTINNFLFIFDSSMISAGNPIKIGDTECMNIDSVMRVLYSPDIDTVSKSAVWKELAKRMDAKSQINAGNDVSNYAYIEDSKLYIKNKLPEESTMYLFYISGTLGTGNGKYQQACETVMPIAIKINYVWPTFSNSVQGFNIAEEAQFNDSELGKGYYIYKNQNRMFTRDSIYNTQIKYYNQQGDVENSLVTTSTITYDPSDKITVKTLTKQTDGGNDVTVMEFSINPSVEKGTKIKITIERTIHFVIMSNEDWTNIEEMADISSVSVDYKCPTETFYFVVKNLNVSEEEVV